MEKINITIIGAGVIGLAVGAELSKDYQDIFIVERNYSFGQETSSRNSEVIHAGIYYPEDSLKAKTCIEGKHLLYEFCAKNNIGYKKTGKLIVARNKDEFNDLGNLFKRGLDNGVDDLRLLSKNEVQKLEPHIEAVAAIYSPSTSILDSHGFMKKLIDGFESRMGQIAYNTELIGIEKKEGGFMVSVEDKTAGTFKFASKIVINAAGLNSDKVAQMAGIKKDEYRLKYCKGDYFRVHNNKARFIRRLVYPVPKQKGETLGIHAGLDLAGGLRLGPDAEYINKIDYNVDASKQEDFYESVRGFLPFISLEDLLPDTAGIRPKLQGRAEDFKDFVIKDEAECGLPGFVDLIGIESPGLTSSLSIARIVKEIVKDIDTFGDHVIY